MNPGPGPAPGDPDPACRTWCEDDEPLEWEDEGDYYDDPNELAEIVAEARQASADQAAAEANVAASGETAALAAAASVAMGRRGQARGHDPGVKLRHLSQVRHATCTGPCCRKPSARSDFEHSVPYEAGGRSCLCNVGPKCRYDHRLKQNPRWHVDQLPDGTFRWTTPSGRQYATEPTRYPT